MSQMIKREIILVFSAIITVIMFVEFFFWPGLVIAETLRTYATIIANISLGLGAITLVMTHIQKIQRRTEGMWQFSVLLIVFFVISLFTGLAGFAMTGGGQGNPIYDWIFRWIYTPLGQTLYPITGFFIFSAGYRAFRARNLDAALLLISGCFVLLTNAPVGATIWSGFPIIGRWFLDNGQVPGMRTFAIVGALGMLAYGFRALLGRETGFYAEVAEG
ncbi:MAG: hypothetical protein ACLFVP_04730 [Candidatus Bathyarchaeia archaeon]